MRPAKRVPCHNAGQGEGPKTTRPSLIVDHFAPRPGGDLCSSERLAGVLVDVVAARTVFVGEHWKCLDRVENIADVRTFEDAVNVGQDRTGDRGSHRWAAEAVATMVPVEIGLTGLSALNVQEMTFSNELRDA